MTSSVSIKELSLDFGAVSVLKNLNLEIQDGEFLVLLGSSGCGKSTLLNCIAGLLDITEGQIFIKGKNVTWEEPKDRGIGMVFQSYALYPQMTVEKNLSFGLHVAKVPQAEIDKRIARAAEILQIQPLLKRKPAELSGGQRQRVAIGRALVRDVDVFLFDEPLSNLDAKLRSELRVEIKRLHQSLKNTMIYVTHDQIEALTLADRIAIMKNGIIMQLDDPTTIYNEPRNLFVAGFIGSPSMNFLHGELVNRDGKIAFATNDVIFSLDGYKAAEPLVAGRKVILGARPEHIKVNEDLGSGAETHDATVDIEEPMGADNLLWLNHAGHTMSVRINGARRFSPGSRVKLGFDMTVASLFDAQTELRI
ncbi:ABC transporter ATP-binding protein [Agrobacterium sp. SHOUNA12C]|uniref:Sugar ABC transporter n=2 Tax=Rhizobium rhizogenes TaxID=359 RepID=B9JFV3_RHIR8|nr:ABC transporter ATP-binding protein [Rhizobium rhizogenes]ACM26793.1 sugar ABC transporter [Rhizobium rhizogenes K84]KAA6489791.1 ABC transporter ATP-binding protein [Agrobacterium sp. ICMP 7243]MCJ9723087.1 ABC transporter ATP-binding protein [Agrobacterium sp. BETTINA12B]MCJ9758463.1 ABC transporter ATP-binding protein [Agrobacterium sp. SHOUNA12C]OCJ05928.1 ABC transporter ATP-binding protein [Agrobacterium sp. 13-626]OCJ31036.1 ABC transporter ATP-binding protein [Agrobacterium sp. B13